MTIDKKTLKQIEEELVGGHDEVYDDEVFDEDHHMKELEDNLAGYYRSKKIIEEAKEDIEEELEEIEEQLYGEYEEEGTRKKVEETYRHILEEHLRKAMGIVHPKYSTDKEDLLQKQENCMTDEERRYRDDNDQILYEEYMVSSEEQG